MIRPFSVFTLLWLWCALLPLPGAAAERELLQDPHFQAGFHLLEPKPGKRVVYGEVPGLAGAQPIWDLAQWSSRFPLRLGECFLTNGTLLCSNTAKQVICGAAGTRAADLSLAVFAGTEYPRPRQSAAEPWVHLLVQQDFTNPPALGDLAACNFHVEARLNHSRLAVTNDYSPDRHAAQYLIYLSVANCNPKSPGYHECFWFGIPVYDNRHRVVPPYEAQDFGGTKLFIFTPASDTFTRGSTHDGDWVTFERDLLPLMRRGIQQAQAKGFIKGSTDLADYHPMGIFIGWEVPGVFDVDFQIRNLSIRTIENRR